MKRLVLSVLGLCAAAMLIASTAYAGPTADPGIHARMLNQQKRIWQGSRTGELTPREVRRLERQEARIRHAELRMKSDGFLTRGERVRLNRELNRASADIYRAKHNWKRVNTVL